MPKWMQILRRTSVTRELLPLLGWFFRNRGWTIWSEARTLVANTVPFRRTIITDDLIVVAGDSLAAGVGAQDSRSIAALLGERFSGAPLINLGANGKRIADVYSDLSALNLTGRETGAKCAFVVVIAGTMDMIMNTPIDELEADLRRLLDLLASVCDHSIVVQAGSMAAGPRFVRYPSLLRQLAARSDRVHGLLEQVIQDYPGAHYLGELFDWSLSAETMSQPKRWFSPDGFHPSSAWHRKVFEHIIQILRDRGAC